MRERAYVVFSFHVKAHFVPLLFVFFSQISLIESPLVLNLHVDWVIQHPFTNLTLPYFRTLIGSLWIWSRPWTFASESL